MQKTSFWKAGHTPTLLSAFFYFDLSFMVWVLLGPLGILIAKDLGLSPAQKGLMVATPLLAGALLRIVMGVLVDHLKPKKAGFIGQLIVILTAGIDLSVGALLALCATVLASLAIKLGVNPYVAILACLVLGLLPGMRERQRGHIVNVSSLGVLFNAPRFSAYLGSKSALDDALWCVAAEVRRDGVAVTSIYMPLVHTPLVEATRV